MNFKDCLILIIPSIVSVVSIFISNYLGIKSAKINKSLSTKKETYLKFHIPLLQWISQYNSSMWTYYYLIVVPTLNDMNIDFLLAHILNNIQFAPKEVVDLYSSYFSLAGNYLFYVDSAEAFSDKQKNEADTVKRSKIFDEIIINSLNESIKLAE